MIDNMKVLIVEDDEAQAELLLRIVIRLYPSALVLVAHDGRSARALLMSEGNLSLIISDLDLPHLSGLDLLDVASENCKGTAFVLMSGSVRPSDIERAIENGATMVLEKPIALSTWSDLLGSF
ncbi:response regulator [bacterium AH-315-F18]|nr:response regulator [bacterium AH-315-F18]